jgi:predicted DNA-binding transcriptional regulator AlpA
MENVQNENSLVEWLIRIGEVKCLTGLSTATVYQKISVKEFLRPVRLGSSHRLSVCLRFRIGSPDGSN